ncbi:MAG: ABC transporter permease [Chloroflexi bacterium]|nr:ABC transporter permease [Chloroflexota bacterium]
MIWPQFRRNLGAMAGVVVCGLFGLIALFSPLLVPYDPLQQDLAIAQQAPSAGHWLGTDDLGRDLLSRILVGARVSLSMSLSTVFLALVVGGTIGILAGYHGRRVDAVLMRCMDVLQALPGILLAIVVVAILGVGLENVIVAIAISSVPLFARLARGSTLGVRADEYVQAAHVVGASTVRIMLRHVLPNIVAPLIVMVSLRISTVILTASGLSFLGLGAQPPTPEWGAMLSAGRSYLTTSPHIATFPGIAIMLVVLGFNLLGDGLRDALDPRLRY